MADDQKTIESLIGNRRLDPDQWYGVRATAYVRRTAAGRVETRPVSVQVAKVASPDEPLPPPEGGEGGTPDNTLPDAPTAEPK